MARVIEIGVSFGLMVLWVAGLCFDASGWLSWCLLVAGVIAFGGAARFGDSARAGTFGWGLLAVGVFLLWIVALAIHASRWLTWWTFVFACALAMLSLSSAAGRAHLRRRSA